MFCLVRMVPASFGSHNLVMMVIKRGRNRRCVLGFVKHGRGWRRSTSEETAVAKKLVEIDLMMAYIKNDGLPNVGTSS